MKLDDWRKKGLPIQSNTDCYNKMRNRISWRLKKINLFEDIRELNDKVCDILQEEEAKWGVSHKKWDIIVNEMDCDLAERIYEMI